MVADAISHSILPGLVAGFWIAHGPNLLVGFLGAVLAGMVTVAAVESLKKTKNLREDSALGLVFPTMFALGVLWITAKFANVHLDTDAVLFGEITTAPFDQWKLNGQSLGPKSIWTLSASLLLSSVFMAIFKKELKVSTFDPGHAHISKLNPAFIHFLLMLVVSVATVASFTAVGAILSVALIIVPTVTAGLLSQRLSTVIAISAILGIACSLLGVGIGLQIDVGLSGMIAVVLGVVFLIAAGFSPHQGVLAQMKRHRSQRYEYALQALLIHLLQHEGTPDQEHESQREHLMEELGWTARFADATIDRGIDSHWLKLRGEILDLTPEGRHAVREFASRTGIRLTARALG